MAIILRPGLLKDRFSMHAVRDSALQMFGSHGPLTEIPESNFSKGSDFRVQVADDLGDVVGYAMTQNRGGDLYLRQMFVRSTKNRSGVGSMLLHELLSHAGQHGFSSVSLITSRNAPWTIPFYEKFGFKVRSAEMLPKHIVETMQLASSSPEVLSIPGYVPLVGMSREI